MAGGYVYDDMPDIVVLDTTQLTEEAPISELSPCGKSTMKEFLIAQEQVLQESNLLI